MAVIHRTTTLTPNKIELLTPWLPTRPWYVAGAAGPELTKAGGFRLDDPEGAVGIEFLVVTDAAGAQPTAYLVPLTYRGAPLDGAEHALVGTMEHGVLGRRWAYDGCHDPVLIAQLLALIEGRARAQDQNISGAPDTDVTRAYTGDGPVSVDVTAAAIDDPTGTELRGPHGTAIRLHRILRPVPDGAAVPPAEATGHVSGSWQLADGTRARALFAVLYAGRGA
ncbi:maltokinase N-terminal cap-like domain-containing protein [Krasilnikovia sp. MM14-A1004]|uniref:maltokinase N-terminal cap-like domain-containing protein n=1 Tax=Krasilnikovia sp. MM14-A1004 TaxID=3373541 RepID=UPI00399C96E1